MIIHKYIASILVLFLLHSTHIHATEESKIFKSAKMRSYVPDNMVDDAYKTGHDVGYVTGGVTKNIVYSTYKGSEKAGYKTGKIAKKLWRKLWN